MTKEIVVVGAGVIGLSTALAICERSKQDSTHVTVIARHFPDDSNYDPEYTSPWAGAHFRPFPSKNPQEWEESKLTRITQKYFRKLAINCPESSVQFIIGEDSLEDPDKYYQDLAKGYTEDIEDFEILPAEIANTRGAKLATRYKTWVLNPPIYLNYILRRLRLEYGVDFVKSPVLSNLKQVFEVTNVKPSVVINCTGNGLQYDGGLDPESFPIRGQTVLVRPPLPLADGPYHARTITHQSKDGKWTFCITRPFCGGTIIGGTKQVNDLYNKPRESDTKEVLDRAAKIFPELMKTDKDGKKYFDVFQTNVGFRPARNGGFRLERENHGSHKIIHAYGAGGMGYELSYGVGTKVHDLLVKVLNESSRL
ncbi:hypothetical protein CAAN3_06S04852 [[Candida] anglica]